MNGFAKFPELPPWLIDNCNRLGFIEPTPVQENALPEILRGTDVIVQSQTGSGKTLTYALPVLSKIDPFRSSIQAVVVTPTRELGQQVTTVLKQLAANAPKKVRVMTVVEGSNNRRQQLWAVAEPPHIVVGNPPALQRLVDMGKLRLNAVNLVVVDEVDACIANHVAKQELHKLLSRHLSKTFIDIHDVIEQADSSMQFPTLSPRHHSSPSTIHANPSYHITHQTILVSATIPQRKYFAEACFKNGWTYTVPHICNLSDLYMLPENIEHFYVPCDVDGDSSGIGEELVKYKANILCYLLKKEVFSSPDKQCIVFLDSTDNLATYTLYIQNLMNKISSSNPAFAPTLDDHVCILTEQEDIDARKSSMDEFRDGKRKVLLCSDLAARGLDVPNISVVIQLSLPKNAMEYLHRAGRTGRLDRSGTVYSLIDREQHFVIQRYSNELNILFAKKMLKVKK
eukprot:gene25974-31367_t